MHAFWSNADDVLRGGAQQLRSAAVRESWPRLVWQIGAFGACYGAAMGTYAFSAERTWQIFFSALKVPLWMLVTGGLSVPLFAVLYTLWGLRDDFGIVLRALLMTQAGFAIVLAALSPLTLVCYASLPSLTSSYSSAVLWNVLMFGVASLGAQHLLKTQLRSLIAADVRHLKLLRAWLLIYSFVGMQMAWVLRPFIGDPDGTVSFFREGALGNAYVVLWNLLMRWLGA
jgi:hypothetical protein